MSEQPCIRCAAPIPYGVMECPACGDAPRPGTASMPVATPAPPVGTGLESHGPEIAAGDLLEGTWRVERRLGEGGMGTVLLARDLKLDREVAVKVLGRALCGDISAVSRFEREARLTAKLDHPHLVPVYAVGHFHGRPFMVMKRLEGTSLGDLLRARQGPWPWRDVRPLVDQLCKGLSYLHQQGLVHRDIKPSNVHVSPNGHVTLLDFGLLKEVSTELTRSGQVLGTLRFMAPEQLDDKEHLDARADLYALGLMLYRLLAGRLPFQGDDLTVAQKKMVEDAVSASEINPALPTRVGAVLSKLVRRKREDRFSSADEAFAALEAAFAAPAATPPPLPSRRKTPLKAFAAVGVAAALAVVFGFYRATHRGPGPSPAPEISTAPTPKALPAMERTPEPTATPTSQVRGAADPSPQRPPEPAPAMALERTGGPAKPSPALAARPTSPPRTVARAPPAEANAEVKVAVVSLVDGKSSFAQVSIDGQVQGETPAQLSLPPGRHVLKLTKPGFKPYQTELKIASGRPQRLVVDLER